MKPRRKMFKEFPLKFLSKFKPVTGDDFPLSALIALIFPSDTFPIFSFYFFLTFRSFLIPIFFDFLLSVSLNDNFSDFSRLKLRRTIIDACR